MEHVGEWTIHVYPFEHDGDSTLARAVLQTPATTMRAEGPARRNPADQPVPEIGDELAVGRALVELGTVLLGSASDDIAAASAGRQR
jgi:hypothetical protein